MLLTQTAGRVDRLPNPWIKRTLILFGIGILSGMVLNLIRGREAGSLPWVGGGRAG